MFEILDVVGCYLWLFTLYININRVSTVREKVREKNIFQGQGIVREF